MGILGGPSARCSLAASCRGMSRGARCAPACGSVTETVHFRTCNLCEAMCGVAIESRTARRRHPRRRGRPVQPRLHLPEGRRARTISTRSRSAAPAAAPRRRQAGTRSAGTRRSTTVASACATRPARARPRRGRRLPRQPDRPQPRRAHSSASSFARALRHAQPLLGDVGRPAAAHARGAADVRPPAADAGARRRSHRAPARRSAPTRSCRTAA